MKMNTLEKLRDCLRTPGAARGAAGGSHAARPGSPRAHARREVDGLAAADRFLRTRSRQPAGERHGPLQYPLLLLHAGNRRAVRAARARSWISKRSSASCASPPAWASPSCASPGGEPLVRRDLPVLIRRLAAIPGIRDLALTTNGVLLASWPGRFMKPACGASTCTWIRWTASGSCRSRGATSSTGCWRPGERPGALGLPASS